MVQISSKTAAAVALFLGVASACTIPQANQATVDLIAEFEGWYPDIYLDPSGNPTVGYGHLCADSACSDVPYPIPLSVEDGQSLLRSDMYVAEECMTMDTAQAVVLNENQFGAFVSWAFNVGCGNSGSSTLVARLNALEDPNVVAQEELPKWVYSDGVELPGLVRRRDAEVALAITPSDVDVIPAPNC